MGKKRLAEAEELNLVPIMNLVTILIPFLLMAAQFISLAVIDSTLPAIGAPADPSTEELDEEDKPLNLSVLVTDEGYSLSAGKALPVDAPEEGPLIPCLEQGCPSPEAYDTGELTRVLALVKDDYPKEENVILVPESRIAYEVLIRTMDASREDRSVRGEGNKAKSLFPYVVIAGGAG